MARIPHTIKDAPGPLLTDPFGRRLHYLRMSLTDRCNLRCTYCMPSQGLAKLPHQEILRLEELARVARVAVGLGVDKIRLTGGEPLLRRDLDQLLAQLAALDPRPDLRLTTNGLLLAQHLPTLAAHGVSTVNISLDTLDPQAYGRITGLGQGEGRRAFQKVWEGIEAALAQPGLTVKLNVVLLAGANQDELEDFARLTLEMPLAVRFIEYMPVGRHTPFAPDRFLSAARAQERLEKLGRLLPLPQRRGDGPAQRFALEGAQGELGFISAISSHFCSECNRLRLSADGTLVPCLFSDQGLDIKALLRRGADDVEIAGALATVAALKPQRHQQTSQGQGHSGRHMSRLGG